MGPPEGTATIIATATTCTGDTAMPTLPTEDIIAAASGDASSASDLVSDERSSREYRGCCRATACPPSFGLLVITKHGTTFLVQIKHWLVQIRRQVVGEPIAAPASRAERGKIAAVRYCETGDHGDLPQQFFRASPAHTFTLNEHRVGRRLAATRRSHDRGVSRHWLENK